MAQSNLDPIELSINVNATPAQVYRALTSQNELRKWWAPRVIMSKNLVGQEEDRLIEMRLMQAEKYHLVRYSWWGQQWDSHQDVTVITFQIHDLGASRSQTGEGLVLEVSHDGWADLEERNRQEQIWKMAMNTLEGLLAGKTSKPWWEQKATKGSYRQVKMPALKSFVENIEIGRNAQQRRKLNQGIWKVCSGLDELGTWFLRENEEEFELRHGSHRILGMNREGEFLLFWPELKKLLGANIDEFQNRLSVEQDVDVNIDAAHQKFRADAISIELWIRWCQDVFSQLHSLV